MARRCGTCPARHRAGCSAHADAGGAAARRRRVMRALRRAGPAVQAGAGPCTARRRAMRGRWPVRAARAAARAPTPTVSPEPRTGQAPRARRQGCSGRGHPGAARQPVRQTGEASARGDRDEDQQQPERESPGHDALGPRTEALGDRLRRPVPLGARPGDPVGTAGDHDRAATARPVAPARVGRVAPAAGLEPALGRGPVARGPSRLASASAAPAPLLVARAPSAVPPPSVGRSRSAASRRCPLVAGRRARRRAVRLGASIAPRRALGGAGPRRHARRRRAPRGVVRFERTGAPAAWCGLGSLVVRRGEAAARRRGAGRRSAAIRGGKTATGREHVAGGRRFAVQSLEAPGRVRAGRCSGSSGAGRRARGGGRVNRPPTGHPREEIVSRPSPRRAGVARSRGRRRRRRAVRRLA